MKKTYLLLSLFSIFFFNAIAQENEPKANWEKALKPFNYQDHIVYKTVNGESLEIILFLPKVKKYSKTPVMLYTHGGGWGKGDKYNLLQKVFNETLSILLDNSIACASVEYRLTRPGISTAFDCVVDCKDAGRF